jgi:hypothetical protein
MSERRTIQPLYLLVCVLGIVFTVTACAYGVMMFRQQRTADAYAADKPGDGTMRLLRDHGGKVLGAELALLAAACVAAMASDSRQFRRDAAEKAERAADAPPADAESNAM